MTKIDFENDRMQSVEQIDSAKRLSDKVCTLSNFKGAFSSENTARLLEVSIST
ncbi:MAG: hypothetical protein VW986_03345 [Gammaproteobacteria bacterium]